jgi:heme-degrading monooxygenase HmoA
MVIARLWLGETAAEDADRYVAYMRETGLADYGASEGFLQGWMLRRTAGDRTAFLMVTLWDSMASIEGFAGPDPERAVYYPQDDAYLLHKSRHVDHYEVVEAFGPRRG